MINWPQLAIRPVGYALHINMLVHVGVMHHYLLFQAAVIKAECAAQGARILCVDPSDEQNVCKLVSMHLLMIQWQ